VREKGSEKTRNTRREPGACGRRAPRKRAAPGVSQVHALPSLEQQPHAVEESEPLNQG